MNASRGPGRAANRGALFGGDNQPDAVPPGGGPHRNLAALPAHGVHARPAAAPRQSDEATARRRP
jgi:hypothetical protein